MGDLEPNVWWAFDLAASQHGSDTGSTQQTAEQTAEQTATPVPSPTPWNGNGEKPCVPKPRSKVAPKVARMVVGTTGKMYYDGKPEDVDDELPFVGCGQIANSCGIESKVDEQVNDLRVNKDSRFNGCPIGDVDDGSVIERGRRSACHGRFKRRSYRRDGPRHCICMAY